MDRLTILWLRRDLRLADNPALTYAVKAGNVLPVFIFDENVSENWGYGASSRWWLHHSLTALAADVEKAGATLILRRGNSLTVLRELIHSTKAKAVYWNRRYEPDGIAQDKIIKEALTGDGIDTQSFNANLLVEPWEIKNGSGECYKVYTPYWKACLKRFAEKPLAPPHPAPKKIPGPEKIPPSDTLDSWKLLPTQPDWSGGMQKEWLRPRSSSPKDGSAANGIGEKAAQKRFENFIDDAIEDYTNGRDYPARGATSRLSPHLAFGEISPRQIWHTIQLAIDDGFSMHEPSNSATRVRASQNAEKFLSEIGWREFAHHLLYHFPFLPEKPLQKQFENFPWRDDPENLQAWQRGLTGYPIVDAGMRQLWQTGWMHNRVRMIVGSFLVKNLLISWRVGEAWFWDTLVDADLANNTAGWQWIGGCGADAAPYFRIFNPVLQSEKFDKDGAYIRTFVPELKKLPDEFIHAPWKAPKDVLHAANITLGQTYPKPIVDHAASRDRALKALQSTKSA